MHLHSPSSRFVRYDVQPMDEVKKAMGALLKKEKEAGQENSSSKESMKAKFNEIPLFGKSFYKLPPINYSPKTG
jgi:hypothetical protein